MNIGKDASRSDGNSTKQLVQFLIVLHCKSDVSRHNTSLLVVTGSISSKLQNLSAEVLEDSGKVDGCSSSHASCVFALTKVAADTTDGELQSSLGR